MATDITSSTRSSYSQFEMWFSQAAECGKKSSRDTCCAINDKIDEGLKKKNILQKDRYAKGSIRTIYVVNDVIYVNIYGNVQSSVVALNAINGTVLKDTFPAGTVAIGIDKNVMYLTVSNSLIAFDLMSRDQIWQTLIVDNQRLNEQMSVQNGVIYVSSQSRPLNTSKGLIEAQDSYVYAVDSKTGHMIWQSPTINGFIFNVTGDANGRVYFGTQNQTVYAYDIHTKQLVWQQTIARSVFAPPLVQNGVVYFGQSSAGWNIGNEDALLALDATSGTQIWSVPIQYYVTDMQPLLYQDGTIYIGTTRGVMAIDAVNGRSSAVIPASVMQPYLASSSMSITGLVIILVP